MSKVKVCGNCEGKMRVGRKAMVHEPDGTMRGPVLVCPRCYSKSVAVCVPPPTTIAPTCAGCHKNLAQFCAGCVERLGGHVRELSAQNVALAASYPGRHRDGAPPVLPEYPS